MRLLNPRFHGHQHKPVVQLVSAIGFMIAVLVIMTKTTEADILGAIGASSLAASACLLFSVPSAKAAKPLNIFLGYFIGISSGVLWHALTPPICQQMMSLSLLASYEVCSVLAIATSMLLMMILGFVHPPAVGLSLGLVVEYWQPETLYIILAAASLLAVLKKIYGEKMVDLI